MAKVGAGLKKLAERDLLPSGEYQFRVTQIIETRDGTGELARLQVLEGPESGLEGKHTVMYILNKETGQAIGLSQIMMAIQMEDEIEDTNEIVGAEFYANVTEDISKKTQQRVNNVTPIYDEEWWNEFLTRPEGAPSKSKKKASRKR